MTCIWLLLCHTLYIVIPLKRYARWFSVFCCWMDWLVIFSCFSFSLNSVWWSEKHFSFLHRMVCSLSSIHIKRIPWYMLHKWCTLHTPKYTYALIWPLAEFHLKIGTAMKRWTIFFKLQHRAIAHRAFSLLHLVIELEFVGCYIFFGVVVPFYIFAVDHGKTGIWFSIDFASHVCHKNQIYMIYQM